MGKNNGFLCWLKKIWFLIPLLIMTGITIFSWVKGREIIEIKMGNTIESIVKSVEEMEKGKDKIENKVDKNENDIQKLTVEQAILKTEVSHIKKTTDKTQDVIEKIWEKVK